MKRNIRVRAQYRPEPDMKKLITVLLAVARQRRDTEASTSKVRRG